MKPQEDLLKKYTAQEIAPKGTENLGVNWATKFWTRVAGHECTEF